MANDTIKTIFGTVSNNKNMTRGRRFNHTEVHKKKLTRKLNIYLRVLKITPKALFCNDFS